MITLQIDGTIDMVAEPVTQVQVEAQQQVGGIMLYVHVDGKTVLRIGRLKQEQVDVQIDPLL